MWIDIPEDLRQMLEPGERILWYGKPARVPYTVRHLAILPFVLFMMILPAPFILASDALKHLPVIAFFALWYGSLGLIGFGPVIYALLAWKNVYYVVTNRRVIERRGVVGIDYSALDLDLIQHVDVDVGFWDKKYGTGTITVSAVGLKPIVLLSVERPREVYAIIRRAVEERRRSRQESG